MSTRRNLSGLHDPKLSVVIPVYNEKPTIDEILRRVLESPIRKEVLVIDDCSTDGTRQILEGFAACQARGESSAPANDGRGLDEHPVAQLEQLRAIAPTNEQVAELKKKLETLKAAAKPEQADSVQGALLVGPESAGSTPGR